MSSFYSLEALLGCDPASLSSAVIGIVGSGGKTSLMSYLARAFAERGRKVLLTTTTKVYPFPGVATLTDPADLPAAFSASPIVCLGRRLTDGGKVEGDEDLDLPALRELADLVLIEGDGARRRPLKVHLPHDPILPADADRAIAVVGAKAVDRRVSAEILHRADRIPPRWRLDLGDLLTADRVADLALQPEGFLSKVAPVSVRVLINQAEAYPEAARQLAEALGRRWAGPLVLGSAREGKFARFDNGGPRVSVLMLAAGRSERFAALGGGDKRRFLLKDRPLLDWSLALYQRQRVIERVLVLGPAEAEAELAGWGLRRGFRTLHMERAGGRQTESLQTGLRAVNRGAEAVLVALADMPAVSPDSLSSLLQAARQRPARCIRPFFGDEPGHPVLLPRSVFPRLLALRPEQPVRELLRSLDPFPLECPDPGVILDLDLPEQAERIASYLPDPPEGSDAV